MLRELSPHLTDVKRRELTDLVEAKHTQAALAAEAELAVLWALSRKSPKLVVEPADIAGRRRLEAKCADIFPFGPAAFEVRAISDDTMACFPSMERAANIIKQFCNRRRKGSGNRLSFRFAEITSRDGRWLERKPFVTPNYQISREAEDALGAWLKNEQWPTPKCLRLQDNDICVDITANEIEYRRISVHSTIPPLIYHPEKNPIYNAIRKKYKTQLRYVPSDYIKCLILFDVGSEVLQNLSPLSSSGSQLVPEEVIEYARRKFDIDLIVVISAKNTGRFGIPDSWLPAAERDKHWRITCFCKNDEHAPIYVERLQDVFEKLPPPRIEANLARQLHEQGAFAPEKNKTYLGFRFTSNAITGNMTLKISSRLLQELLAGRIDVCQFERETIGTSMMNPFEYQLAQGRTISSVSFEHAGIDEDDDWVVFDFSRDPAASSLDGAGKE